MTFVLDASVTMSWILSEESSAAGLRLRDKLTTERAVVPALWTYEVANALLMAVRRGRLGAELLAESAAIIANLPIDLVEPGRDMTSVLDLAAQHGLSAYDAAYLHLALTSDVPLATVDERLASAARAAGVSVIEG